MLAEQRLAERQRKTKPLLKSLEAGCDEDPVATLRVGEGVRVRT